jgi:hypothetical protein
VTITIPNNLLTGDSADFEGGVGGWTSALNASVANSAAHPLDGAKCGAFTATVAGTAEVYCATAAVVTPGLRYAFSLPVLCAGAGRSATAYIAWYGTAGSISTSSGTATVLNAGAYTQVSVAGAAPAGATYFQALLVMNATANGDVFYTDQAYAGPGYPNLVKTGGGTGGAVTPVAVSYTSAASGDSLVAIVSMDQGTSATLTCTAVTDSAGNTWAKIASAYDNSGVTGSQGIAVFTCTAALPVTGLSVAFSAAPVSSAVAVFELSAGFAYEAQLYEAAGTLAFAQSAAATTHTDSPAPNIVGDLMIGAIATRNANATSNLFGAVAGSTTTLSYMLGSNTTTGVANTSFSTWVFTSGAFASCVVSLLAQPYIVSITPSQGLADEQIVVQGLTGYDTLTVTRSDPNGNVVNVRAGNGVAQAGDAAFVADYEQPLGVLSSYVVTATHHNINATVSSAVSGPVLSEIATSYGETWLKNIAQPAASMLVNMVGPQTDVTRPPLNTVYQVLGTPYPVVVGDVLKSRTGNLVAYTSTIAQMTSLLALCASGQVLFFQATAQDNFPDMYFMVTAGLVESRPEGFSSSLYRKWTIPFTEVASPSGAFSLLPGNSWSQVLSFGSWQNVLSWRSSWLSVLNVPYGSGSPE